MTRSAAFGMAMVGLATTAQAQTNHVPATTSFYNDCLQSGGSPASVGNYPNIVVMPIYNGKTSPTAATAARFSITVAPSTDTSAAAYFEREPIPAGETADFVVRQGRVHFLSATRLKMVRSDGKMDLCIKQF
ncbi:MAG TPA: hypothetical protein VF662_10265 [Allosphingosinicella sp.]